MGLRVAVDFGTSSTCVALSAGGREPQVVVFDGQPLVPSAVFAAADGTLFVGHEAERHAAVDPSRYEPTPKRRVDEGELLLGSTVLPVADVVRAVLTRAVAEARRVAGGPPVDQLVLTHPADWGAIRTGVLSRAAAGLGREVVLVPEPVAAAVFHSAAGGLADGAALAVLDLGGGTVDASVVARRGGRFQVLATKGDPGFGGADVDQLLLDHLGSSVGADDAEAWRQLVEGRELADRRRRRVLRQDVRGAKETLSRHAYTDVPMPPPFRDAHVTRADLEGLISAPLDRVVALVVAAVRDAGLTPLELAGVFLVGGSSRIPLVARLVHEQSGVVPTSIDQPETVVARGALTATAPDADRARVTPGVDDPTRRIAPRQFGTGQTPVQQGFGQGPGAGSGPHTGGQRALPHAGDSTRKITRKISATEAQLARGPDTAPGWHTSFPVVPQQNWPPPQPPPSRRWRVPLLVTGGVVLVALVAALVVHRVVTGAGSRSTTTTGTSATAPTSERRSIAQYDYSFALPEDWTQSGGDVERRKVQLVPAGSATSSTGSGGDDVIVVQEQVLTYDSTEQRDRAVAELRSQVEATENFSGFDDSAVFAGKEVVHFQEALGSATADWYVVFRGEAQVSVGCQYGGAGSERVATACEQVVRTLRVTS
ncbi:type VII secretion-associated protein [Umezawaea beigongshangensis]|uniref:type VII secretion-associated protein n=1 Tax=Umezawaea beigongshangensis TaxID=2780383 RepID=UPI0018F20811|nr:type VII secretion-associated protein [Umezawaea beigongshangensis]